MALRRIVWLATMTLAAACRRGPDVASSEVRQPGASLVWLRCPIGQTWDGARCAGKASGMTWDAARTACPAGHRLPTSIELSSVLCGRRFCGCKMSVTCSSMFGADDEGFYWSSSSNGSGSVQLVWFFDGNVTWEPDTARDHVRCVR